VLEITNLNFAYGKKVIFEQLLKLIAEKHNSVRLQSKARATMVMQEGALLDHLNVIENLNLVLRHQASSDDLESRLKMAGNALLRLNIDASLHQSPVSQLSGGQIRRVAIARALLTNPDLILFDEPDAGLDIANLRGLATVVGQLTSEQNKVCITVSHNPFYIARLATKVYRLERGRLKLIADWSEPGESEAELSVRQQYLQAELGEPTPTSSEETKPELKRDRPVLSWLNGLVATAVSLFQIPRSPKDQIQIGAYTVYLSLITGLLFFALVGLMLGSTTMAVVKMLSDNALSGWVGMLVKPETLVNMMGGRYVLYLAPSIGGMLFAARSGSIVSNWLGEMTRGRQVQALSLLDVPPAQYLRAPVVIALFLSMCAAIAWFAYCVWLGGVLTTHQLFDLSNTGEVMALTAFDLKQSLIAVKTVIYSTLVAFTVVSMGLTPKKTTHQVNIHTTKTIIYSTLCIAAAELLMVLN